VSDEPSPTARPAGPVPRGSFEGFRDHLQADITSGFLVFLIALPLCLGISMASGYPPVAGLFTAVIGGLMATFISNAEVAIKGPAAGLIVIAYGAVTELAPGDPVQGYKMALGVGVVAGIVQIAFGLLRTGVLGEFFPTAAVHGMLAAIGVIIMSKQAHTMMGVKPEAKEPLELIAEIPHSIAELNPEVAIIGFVGLAILVAMQFVPFKPLKKVPAQMVVLLVAVPLAAWFDLGTEHHYSWNHHDYTIGPKFLVDVPTNLFGAMTFPDFSGVMTRTGLKYVVLFSLIGTLESLLSAKATDLLDPYQRKTNYNRDVLAIGIGNTLAAMIGGLPMITEIVRSSANITNGAKTRFANFWHSAFLLASLALIPSVLHRIPLAALAAMLVFTGFRLASPREFGHMWKVGKEQFAVFATTLVVTLATDLLVGVFTGIALEFALNLWAGLPLRATMRPHYEVSRPTDGPVTVKVTDALAFCNWIPFLNAIEGLGPDCDVVVDVSGVKLVDHTAVKKLFELSGEFSVRGHHLDIVGLDRLHTDSTHPLARRRGVA
jgi:MFS superfamily sulfate permease-like transporter